MAIQVEKVTLYTGTDIIEFENQKALSDYLGITNCARSMILRRCRVLDYEVDFPLRNNEKPLK